MSIWFWIFWIFGMLVSTFLGSYVARHHRNLGYMVFSVMLAIYIVSANILVPRFVQFPIFNLAAFTLVTGSIIWPYTSQVSDMINEIYGRKRAYLSAAIGYVANLMFVAFILMSFQTTPTNPANIGLTGALQYPVPEEAFHAFFQVAWRVLIASTLSYTASNFVDIRLFSMFKNWSMQREHSFGSMMLYSSGRSAVSDAIAMVIDNLVFYTVAFAGVIPWAGTTGLVAIMISSGIAKVILSQVDLPFFWLFKYMTRGVERDM